jgi:hypothetical protein
MRVIKPWRNEHGCETTPAWDISARRRPARRQPTVVRRQNHVGAKGKKRRAR